MKEMTSLVNETYFFELRRKGKGWIVKNKEIVQGTYATPRYLNLQSVNLPLKSFKFPQSTYSLSVPFVCDIAYPKSMYQVVFTFDSKERMEKMEQYLTSHAEWIDGRYLLEYNWASEIPSEKLEEVMSERKV
jgi:hypothetical protein